MKDFIHLKSCSLKGFLVHNVFNVAFKQNIAFIRVLIVNPILSDLAILYRLGLKN